MTTRNALRLVLLLTVALALAGCGATAHQPRPGGTQSKAHGAVRAAYSQVGAPYVLGGASPRQGFDCSGLVYWAYRTNGVAVPRITRDQARAGQPVARGQARPGDIMVFRIDRNKPALHTAIYAGGNTFVHSPSRGKTVRMETLSKPFWHDRLVGVRRVSS